MSLDKYVMRGFTGSLGSGEGRWVATAAPATSQPSQRPDSSSGTSFVMGGNPRGGGGSRAGGQGSTQQFREDRYSFDAAEIRSKGSVKEIEKAERSFMVTTFADAISSKGGEKFLTALFFIGLLIVGLVYVLSSMTGDDLYDRREYRPHALGRAARPLWDR